MTRPLPERLRPQSWGELILAEQGLAEELQRSFNSSASLPSIILWGPPGVGKTTIAHLLSEQVNAEFVKLSAVLSSVKEVREVIKKAREREGSTVLFLDEIHRFNKSQQDAFLPHLEDGTIALLGATTENPSFYLNRALLSRVRVLRVPSPGLVELEKILARAEKETSLSLAPEAREMLLRAAGSDARRLLQLVESLQDVEGRVGLERVKQIAGPAAAYDRADDLHYDLASAFIKSLRGSAPDAALYYGLRMLHGGEDPRFLFRRLIIFAGEDIGNADQRALPLAVAAAEAYDRVGLPEGEIPLAQCITYLASAPKSNRSYLALKEAKRRVKEFPTAPVPTHLRNAPTALMREQGFGKGYQYPHDFPGGYVKDVWYLPDEVQATAPWYRPIKRGFEAKIVERFSLLGDPRGDDTHLAVKKG